MLSGIFELTDSERQVTGAIRVELKWKFAYLPPSASVMAVDLRNYIQNEKSMASKLLAEDEMQNPVPSPLTSSVTVSNLTNLQKLKDTKDLLQQVM